MNELPKSVRDELARQQVSGSSHPEADLLTAFSEGSATASERKSIEQHLALCADCREVVFLAAPEVAAESLPVFSNKSRKGWFRWWMPATATAVVLITATFMFVREERNGPEQAQLAKDKPLSTYVQPVRAPAEQTSDTEKTDSTKTALSAPSGEPGDTLAKAKEPAKKERATAMDGKEAATSSVTDGAKDTSQFAYSRAKEEPPTPRDTTSATSHARNNSSLKPGPAAPVQNQVAQNQSTGGQLARMQAPPVQGLAKSGAAQNSIEVNSEAAPAATVSGKNYGFTPPDITAAHSLKSVMQNGWRISASGAVERSDEGGAWTTALSRAGIRFTIVSVIGNTVWAGGDQLALFRSRDNGITWTPITLPTATATLKDSSFAVTAIDFQDDRNGTVSTSDRRIWTTSDGGDSWRVR